MAKQERVASFWLEGSKFSVCSTHLLVQEVGGNQRRGEFWKSAVPLKTEPAI